MILNRYFWLALSLHLILLLSYSASLISHTHIKPQKPIALPAYFYPSNIAQPKTQTAQPVSKQGILKSSNTISSPQQNHSHSLPQLQTQHIADENEIDKPLLALLHNATAANLIYPAIAIDFNEKGIVKVGFQIDPNGRVTQIKLAKSSGYDPLDQAAIAAVRAMSPVTGVKQYLQKAKFLVVDVIFR
jgi:TonB family protein